MAEATSLRSDFTGDDCRRLARESGHANETRRLLGLASIHDAGSRSHAARWGGVSLQVIRDWALHFKADGPAQRRDRKASGAEPKLTSVRMQAVADILEHIVDFYLPRSLDETLSGNPLTYRRAMSDAYNAEPAGSGVTTAGMANSAVRSFGAFRYNVMPVTR